jgi:phosphopantothenate-cysteine ligase/phosphopantothenoylcysteine decarboxylase/phosphopantothenate--cysteine ligase
VHVLVTAGNTHTPIDRVRVITNIFTGRTGANVAAAAVARGHRVTLLTSHPETADHLRDDPGFRALPYRTFDDLHRAMAALVPAGGFDAVVHSAAVSDYHCGGVYAAAAPFDGRSPPALTDVSAGKVKSSHPEVWIRLTPAPKLVDLVRAEWGFRGVLVKFKLEVGVSEDDLRRIAERSRLDSGADLMSANTLEGAAEWALVGGPGYVKVPRAELANHLVEQVERRNSATTRPS